MRLFRLPAATALWVLSTGLADVRNCVCEPTRPDTMQSRECSLCRAADAQAGDAQFFVIRDANPNKPNRWLALPRFHGRNPQDLPGMTAEQRTAYWTVAIQKGQELWGEAWGLAVNSLERRTQCHMHIHIGKLADGSEDDSFITVDGPARIPLPQEGDGMWVHPTSGKLHVHSGNQAPELLLLH